MSSGILVAAGNNFKEAQTEITSIEKRFKVGDQVTSNSEAGRVSGTIIKVHTRDVDYKGHIRGSRLHGITNPPRSLRSSCPARAPARSTS
jgi:hypothetical protein